MEDIRSIKINSGLINDSNSRKKEVAINKILSTMKGMSFSNLISSLGLKSEITILDDSELAFYDDERVDDRKLFESEMLDLFMIIRVLIDLKVCNGISYLDLDVINKIHSAIEKRDASNVSKGLPTYKAALERFSGMSVKPDDFYYKHECWKVINEVERTIKNELEEEFFSADDIINFRNRYDIPSFRNFMLKLQSSFSEEIDMHDIYDHIDEISNLLVCSSRKSSGNYLVAFNSQNTVKRVCPNKYGIKRINVGGYNHNSGYNGDVCYLMFCALEQPETDSDILNLLCDSADNTSDSMKSVTYKKF